MFGNSMNHYHKSNKYRNLQLRIKNTRGHIIIKKIISVFVLSTFLLSITPKQVLHNVLADHSDIASKKVDGSLQFNTAAFSCDCNSIVATSPFTETKAAVDFRVTDNFCSSNKFFPPFLLSVARLYTGPRGPPAV